MLSNYTKSIIQIFDHLLTLTRVMKDLAEENKLLREYLGVELHSGKEIRKIKK